MRTPSAIVAELEAAFVGGNQDRELLTRIREMRAAIDSAEPDKPLAKRLQEIIELPVRNEYDRGYQACAKMMLGSIDGAADQKRIDSQAAEALHNEYYANNLRQ